MCIEILQITNAKYKIHEEFGEKKRTHQIVDNPKLN